MCVSVRVLLIGKRVEWSSGLREYLIKKSCQIECARSIDHGLALIHQEPFDIVLGPMNADACERARLVAALLNSPAHLFFPLAVEDGSWWFPVVSSGQHCLGAPAVRARDFLPALDKLLLERKSDLEKWLTQVQPSMAT